MAALAAVMIQISTDSRSVTVIDAETGESIYEKDADRRVLWLVSLKWWQRWWY